MSADIWLESKDGEPLDFGYQMPAVQNISNVTYGNHFNLTYNLSPMLWQAGMPAWRDMVGMSAAEAGAIWNNVVIEMVTHPDKYKPYNPKNGWGSYEQALEVLGALVTACRAHPEAVIAASL